MRNEIVEQLKKLRHGAVEPRAEWLERNRAQLMSQIRNTVPAKVEVNRWERIWEGAQIFVPRSMAIAVVRPVAVLVLVAFTITSLYTGTVKASYDTLPGDWLYPAKRAAERTEGAVISVLGDKTSQTKFHVNMATRRAEETKKIIKKNDPTKAVKVAQVVQELKAEIKTINNKLEDKGTASELQAGVAKDVTQQVEQIKDTLQAVKNELLVTGVSTTEAKDLTKEVTETKDLAKDVSVKAVEVVVAKHLEGDQSVSKDEVKALIEDKIQNAINDAQETKDNVEGAKMVVDTVNSQIKGLTVEMKKTSDLTPATAEFTKRLDNVAVETKEAAKKADEGKAEVDKKVEEVKDMVVNGDLTGAIDKLREMNAVTKEVEKISDTTVVRAQEVLPIVQVIRDVVDTATTNASASTTPSVSTTVDINIKVVSGTVKVGTGGVPAVVTSTVTVSTSVTTTILRNSN